MPQAASPAAAPSTVPAAATTTAAPTALPIAPTTPASATAVPPATPTATAAATALPSASPAAPGGIGVHLGETFTLKVSQWATVLDGSNSRIILTNIFEDTRCPLKPARPCDGVGQALAVLSIESNGRLGMFELSTNPFAFRDVNAFGGYVVRLIDVAPFPQQTPPGIALGDYQVTLRVSAGSLETPQARFNEPFSLKPGQTIGIEGSSMRLTFAGVAQDSRCPARVVCVTRGLARVAIESIHDGVTERYELEVGGNGVLTDFPAVRTVAVTIYARELMPYPQQGPVAPGEYRVTLLVNNPAQPLPSPTPR